VTGVHVTIAVEETPEALPDNGRRRPSMLLDAPEEVLFLPERTLRENGRAQSDRVILDRGQVDLINSRLLPPSATPVHVYDAAGKLIGEYGSFAEAIAAQSSFRS
jgi:hypothetical protein